MRAPIDRDRAPWPEGARARRRHGRRYALATLLLLVAGCGAAPSSSDEATQAGTAESWVEIRRGRVNVEVRRTPAEQAQGLSGRKELAWGDGMLFPYASPRPLRFWMKEMNFAIDMVWIREGRIVEISHRVPPPEPGAATHQIPTAQPRELADTVLEVPAGYASAHGWRRGDPVEYGPNAR